MKSSIQSAAAIMRGAKLEGFQKTDMEKEGEVGFSYCVWHDFTLLFFSQLTFLESMASDMIAIQPLKVATWKSEM